MTEDRSDIQGRVLENLLDGLMVVERGGAISAFNAAAARILEISQEEAAGTTFGELFVAREGFEELSDLILDAVAGGDGNGRKTVSLQVGGARRTLSVATSYIRSRRQGADEPLALIVVLTDITELEDLRETERRMAEEMKAQHAELQGAYRQIEDRNENLATTLKKVQVARAMATLLVFAAVVGAGVYAWRPADLFDAAAGAPLAPVASQAVASPADQRRLAVEPQTVDETIALIGELAPWKTVAVPSPIAGRVVAVHVQYGQTVAKGDPLLEVDTGEAVREHREARVAYFEKLKEYETVRDWDTGAEMSAARRRLARAKSSLEDQERQLERFRFLMAQGLIAAYQHEAEKRRHQDRLVAVEVAREDLARVQAEGEEQKLESAALELASAEELVRGIARRLEGARLLAPLSGVVVALSQGARLLYPGRPVNEGDALLGIGDFDRLSATARVDEVDVVRLAVGQAVSVTGDAFPGLELRGTVTHVSSQPVRRGKGAAEFEVVVTLNPLEPGEQERLRSGMSCTLQVVVYRNDDALLVPLEAVEARGRTRTGCKCWTRRPAKCRNAVWKSAPRRRTPSKSRPASKPAKRSLCRETERGPAPKPAGTFGAGLGGGTAAVRQPGSALLDMVNEAVRSLVRARLRTMLGLAGIMVGVASVIAMISAGEIATAESRSEFEALGTDIVTIKTLRGQGDAGISPDAALALAETAPTISEAAPRIGLRSGLRYLGRPIGSGTVQGVTRAFARVNRLRTAEGRFVSRMDGSRFFAVVGAGLAREMRRRGATEIVGEFLQAGDRLYAIVGVLADAPETFALPFRVDANGSVFIPIGTAARAEPGAKVKLIVARTGPGVHYSDAVRDAQSYFTRRAKGREAGDRQRRTTDPADGVAARADDPAARRCRRHRASGRRNRGDEHHGALRFRAARGNRPQARPGRQQGRHPAPIPDRVPHAYLRRRVGRRRRRNRGRLRVVPVFRVGFLPVIDIHRRRPRRFHRSRHGLRLPARIPGRPPRPCRRLAGVRPPSRRGGGFTGGRDRPFLRGHFRERRGFQGGGRVLWSGGRSPGMHGDEA